MGLSLVTLPVIWVVSFSSRILLMLLPLLLLAHLYLTPSPVKPLLFKMKLLMPQSVTLQAQTLSTFSWVLVSHGQWLLFITRPMATNSTCLSEAWDFPSPSFVLRPSWPSPFRCVVVTLPLAENW